MAEVPLPVAFENLLSAVYEQGGNPEAYTPAAEVRDMYSDAYVRRGEGPYVYNTLGLSLANIENAIGPVIDEFDVIVVTGLSGVVPGAIIAQKYGKQLVIIRKNSDVSHGGRMEGKEYFDPSQKFIILDDFIASGSTMAFLMEQLSLHGYEMPLYFVLYRNSISTTYTFTYENVDKDRFRVNLLESMDSSYRLNPTEEMVR